MTEANKMSSIKKIRCRYKEIRPSIKRQIMTLFTRYKWFFSIFFFSWAYEP